MAGWRTYASFQKHFAQLLVESAKLFSMSRPKSMAGVTHQKVNFLKRFTPKGNMSLIAGGHVNNWEWSALASCRMPFRTAPWVCTSA